MINSFISYPNIVKVLSDSFLKRFGDILSLHIILQKHIVMIHYFVYIIVKLKLALIVNIQIKD